MEKRVIQDEGFYRCNSEKCDDHEYFHFGCNDHVIEELEMDKQKEQTLPCAECKDMIVIGFNKTYLRCKKDGNMYHIKCMSDNIKDVKSLLKNRVILTSRMIKYWEDKKVEMKPLS